MSSGECSYVLRLYKRNGDHLGNAVAVPDWEPARQWAWFAACRQGKVPVDGAAQVLPLWHAESGAPYASGFRIAQPVDGEDPFLCDFPLLYWQPLAKKAARRFVDSGDLAAGDFFNFEVLTFEREADSRTVAAGWNMVQTRAQPTVIAGSLSDALRGTVMMGSPTEGEMQVVVSCDVLAAAGRMMAEAGDLECGGMLVGHLVRDEQSSDIFAVANTQIPARHVRSTSSRLTFTPETWTDVRAAIDIRRRNEVLLGWWHYHPARAWCAEEEGNDGTSVGADFFSQDDCNVHKTVFTPAYSVALVLTDRQVNGCWTSGQQMYGWWFGMIVARGFRLAHGAYDEGRARPVATLAIQGGKNASKNY